MTPDQIDLFSEFDPQEKIVKAPIIEIEEPEETAIWSELDDRFDSSIVVNQLLKAFDSIYQLNQFSRSTFSDVIELMRYTLHRHFVSGEEKYLEVVKRMRPEAVRAAPEVFGILVSHFTMDERFEDLLGSVYMELGSRWKQAGLGQYFTPWPVCVCMAEMTFSDMWKPTRENPIRVNEPCVGSGSMLLAARHVVAKHHGREALQWLHISGTDIDPVCVAMADVQLLLSDDLFMQSWSIANIPEFARLKEEEESNGS